MDVLTYSKLLIVTDAAINIFPTLDDKRDIQFKALLNVKENAPAEVSVEVA